MQKFRKILQVSLTHRTNFFPKFLQVHPFSQHQIHKKLQVFANHEKQNFRKIFEKFHSFTPPKFFSKNFTSFTTLTTPNYQKKITSRFQPRVLKFSRNFTSFRKGYIKKAGIVTGGGQVPPLKYRNFHYYSNIPKTNVDYPGRGSQTEVTSGQIIFERTNAHGAFELHFVWTVV